MQWNIKPLVGLGPLRFDMTAQEVARILDSMHTVSHRHTQEDGSIAEFRGLALPVCNYAVEKLQTIDTTYRVDEVVYDGQKLYETESRTVLQILERANEGAKAGLGMVFFDKLCINTTGFFDKKSLSFYDITSSEQDERGISASKSGAFDALMQYFKPLSFF